MNLAQMLVLSVVGLIIFVNLLHPGGWLLAFIIILLIFLFYAAYEFLPEYILVTNQGKNARKNPRRERRAKGLIPFFSSRSGQRREPREAEPRQTETQQGGRNE